MVATTLALRGSFEGQGFPPRSLRCAREEDYMNGEGREGREGSGSLQAYKCWWARRVEDARRRGWRVGGRVGVCARGGESPVPSIYSACEPVDSG